MKWHWLGTIVLGVAGTLTVAHGMRTDGLRADEVAEISEEDLGFGRYANSELFAQALDNADASLAADFTLQLVEGERVLQRSHAAITSEQSFAITLRMARETGDKATLDRLASAAEKLGKKDWTERLDGVRKLGAAARSAALPKVSDKLSPDAQQVYGAVYEVVQNSRLSGDVSGLDAVAGVLPECQDLSDDQKTELGKLVSSTKSDITASLDPALQKLYAQVQGAARSSTGTLAIDLEGGQALSTTYINSAPIVIANASGDTLPVMMTGTLAISIPSKQSLPVKPKPGVSTVVVRKGLRVPKITTKSGFPPRISVTYTFVTKQTYRLPAASFGLTGGSRQKLTISN